MYTGDLSKPIEYIRFFIGDTEEPFLMTDKEINSLLTIYTTVDKALIAACRGLIARYHAEAIDNTTGPVSVKASQIVDNCMRVLREARVEERSKRNRNNVPVAKLRDSIFKIGMYSK